MTLDQDNVIYSIHSFLEVLANTDDAEHLLASVGVEGLLIELEDAFPELELQHTPVNEFGEDNEIDEGMTDAEADADALRGIGWGCGEDYGEFDERI